MRTHRVYSSPTVTDYPATNRRNILIVGDVGVGKSSLVNLIADEERAITSSGARSCTLSSQEHVVHLGGVELVLHDTAGLHEAQGQMKKTAYLDAVHQAYALISKLERSGGISLLVFCMKGGRISLSTQQTYSLFVDVLCNRQVPVTIAVTHLENQDDMEQWWVDNDKEIKEYGLKSIGHACITTTRGYKNAFTDKYDRSREIVRQLILEQSGRVAWKEEKASWVRRVVMHMRHWLSPRQSSLLDSSDLRKKLVRKCGFSAEDAELVAQQIEQTRGITIGGDVREEDKVSFMSEKASVQSDSCVSLPIIHYTS